MTDAWRLAASHWDSVYHPPLLPGAAELALISQHLQAFTSIHRELHALLMGVTPAYLDLPWPKGASLLAVDHSRSMIDKVWHGRSDQVLHADWFDMALPAGSRNFVLCDGGLCLQPWPHAQRQLVRVMAQLMPAGGLAIMRCFVLPPQRETLARILQDLQAGHIRNFSELQLRLWMVLQTDRAQGTSNQQVRAVLNADLGDRTALAALPGAGPDWWQHDAASKELRRFWFSDIEEIIGWFTVDPGGFELQSRFEPPHALGAYCPTLVLQRR